jgi:hypothetical protein
MEKESGIKSHSGLFKMCEVTGNLTGIGGILALCTYAPTNEAAWLGSGIIGGAMFLRAVVQRAIDRYNHQMAIREQLISMQDSWRQEPAVHSDPRLPAHHNNGDRQDTANHGPRVVRDRRTIIEPEGYPNTIYERKYKVIPTDVGDVYMPDSTYGSDGLDIDFRELPPE